MKILGRSLIGQENAALNDKLIYSFNPRTNKRLEPGFSSATEKEVERAINLADCASMAYRDFSGAKKAIFLNEIATGIESNIDLIIERAGKETALPEARLRGETARTCNQLRMFAKLVEEGSWVDAHIDRADPERQPIPKPDVRSMKRPIGPVAVFGASNFPLAFSVAGGDTASAFAAGNPVVAIAHYSHPGTAELIGRVILKAAEKTEMPEGIFSLLFGSDYKVGQSVVAHPGIKAVGFTGSRQGGTALIEIAANRPNPIPVYAEMSSINPVFILPEAIKNRASEIATGLSVSVTLGVGQFCTNPGLIFLPDGEQAEIFKTELAEKLSQTAPATMLNKNILTSYNAGIQNRQGQNGVATIAKQDSEAGAALFESNATTFLNNPDLHTEIFGPSTLLVKYANKKEMEKVALSLEGQLTATVHADNDELNDYADLLRILETRSGRLIYNGYPTGVEVCSAMVHGGPFPATSDSRSTSVGTQAIDRFTRLVCYQDFPESSLPDELKSQNPSGIWRLVDNSFTNDRF